MRRTVTFLNWITSLGGHAPDMATRFFRHSTSGTLLFLVDISLLALFVESLEMHYLFAVAVAFIISHTLNYLITRQWGFRGSGTTLGKGYSYFIAIGLAGAGATVILVGFFVEYLGLYYLLAKVIVAAIVGVCNFLFNYYITFKIHHIQ
ncbi:MAG TPA: GtrA family protein [Candidatus Nanoarchaeia archaeon]|nr:GtrA family protein [Candidatus Nanoarchaeia archaeon]